MAGSASTRNRQKISSKKQQSSKELQGQERKVVRNSKNYGFYLLIAVVGITASVWLISARTDLVSSFMARKSSNPKEAPNSQKNKGDNIRIKDMNNRYDKKIIKELNKAQKFLEQGNIEKALQEFSFLVGNHWNSPRARYGKAQAIDRNADKQRSNNLVLEAVKVYKEAAEIKDCPKEIIKLSLKRAANRLKFLGKYRQAVSVLELLSSNFPDDPEQKNDIGIQFLYTGDNDNALKAFKKALKLSPSNGCAKSHIGFILKTQNKLEEAIPYLEDGLKSGDPRSEQGNFYYHLGDAYQRLGDRTAAYRVYETGAKRGFLLSAMQRSLYNADTKLKAQPWWSPRETSYAKDLAKLESKWKIIRDEAVGLLSKTGNNGFAKEAEGLQDVGDWRQLTLFSKGRLDGPGCHRAPKTCDIVKSMAAAVGCNRGQIKFSVMFPGTHVWPHTGPTNCRLRAHLGLVIPKDVYIKAGGETRTWQEGKVLVFDDSFEHEVWHNGTSYRLILIIDFWHPELTDRQRHQLTPI